MILKAVWAVTEREIIRMSRQKVRLFASMVRPLIWLFVIGSGVGSIAPEINGQPYTDYLIPGVLGMTVLFGAMLAALTTVYDKESGVMRMMIVAPLPHYWIVMAKALSASIASLIQACFLIFILVIIGLLELNIVLVFVAGAIALASLCCSGIGMLTACFSKSLDNFAAVMNFVIFPIFFISGSLYPVDNLPFLLKIFALVNPYTYAVDLIKHSLSKQNPLMSGDMSLSLDICVVIFFSIFAITIASWAFSREHNHEPLIKRITNTGP